MPVEPPASRWRFPDVSIADEDGLIGLGADLEPATVLHAYRCGAFPMPARPGGPMGWWSPDPRAVLPLDALRVTRSLRRSCARFEVRVDSAFAAVVDACADPHRPGGWISGEIQEAYGRLHELGWTHSVEAWDEQGLAGGLYGMAIGGLFAGESMFHRRRDASKVALVALVDILRADGADRILDVQWPTEHLVSLGVETMPRARYVERLREVLAQPLPPIWR